MNQFLFNCTECAVGSQWRINHVGYFFPGCTWIWINTIAHTGKLSVIFQNSRVPVTVWWKQVFLLSSDCHHVMRTFVSVHMVLKSDWSVWFLLCGYWPVPVCPSGVCVLLSLSPEWQRKVNLLLWRTLINLPTANLKLKSFSPRSRLGRRNVMF